MQHILFLKALASSVRRKKPVIRWRKIKTARKHYYSDGRGTC